MVWISSNRPLCSCNFGILHEMSSRIHSNTINKNCLRSLQATVAIEMRSVKVRIVNSKHHVHKSWDLCTITHDHDLQQRFELIQYNST